MSEPDHQLLLRSTFALRLGTPNSLRQTSASAATPSRISCTDGLAKHSRKRLLLCTALTDHSVPGLIAMPDASAA